MPVHYWRPVETDQATVPDCRLFVDGAAYADGCLPFPENAPTAMSGLKVTWGRSSTVDQPAPATCTFTVLDVPGGADFRDQLYIGARVQVRATGTVYGNATLPMLPADPYSAVQLVNARAAGSALTPVDAGQRFGARFLPARPTTDPTGWSAVPVAAGGQPWTASISVGGVDPLGAGMGPGEIVVRPVYYRTPPRPGELSTATYGPELARWSTTTGPHVLTGATFTPPAGAWVGLDVSLPSGPRWADVPASISWDIRPAALAAAHAVMVADNRAVSDRMIADARKYAADHPAVRTMVPRESWTWTVGGGWSPGWRSGWDGTTFREGSVFYPPGAWNVTANGDRPLTVAARLKRTGGSAPGRADVWLVRTREPYARPAGNTTGPPGGILVRLAVGEEVWVNLPADWIGYGLGTWAGDAGTGLDVTLEGGEVRMVFAAPPAIPAALPDPPPLTVRAGVTGLGDHPTWAEIVGWTVDGAAVKLSAPPSAAATVGVVFDGRITDLKAEWDSAEGGVSVQVTAEDQLAELANRYVGGHPWPAQTLGERFAAVVAASGQPVKYVLPGRVSALPVSWDDADRRPALDMLRKLATSGGSALWPAANLGVDGPFIQVEDLDARTPMYVLAKRADGVVRIGLTEHPPAEAVELSACNFLLDPVSWVQSVDDDVTEVDVTWREQTLDHDGKPAPTERHVTVHDDKLEAVRGRRRAQMSTDLAQAAPAQHLAATTLGRLNGRGWRVSGLTWSVEPDDPLTMADLSVLLTVLDSAKRIGLPILLVDLPDWSPIPDHDHGVALILEGLQATYDRGHWTVQLIVSSAESQGTADIPWNTLPAPWVWNDFDPAIRWVDLAGVTL